jgi:hypothetical protein
METQRYPDLCQGLILGGAGHDTYGKSAKVTFKAVGYVYGSLPSVRIYVIIHRSHHFLGFLHVLFKYLIRD